MIGDNFVPIPTPRKHLERRSFLTLLSLVMGSLLVNGQTQADTNQFWSHWADGKAEVSGYTLTQPRYGQSRRGHAVLIYVTEPFSLKKQVKVDRYEPKNPDHITALKLNFVRKFQTGVYDYSVMTSVFVDPQDNMRPLKVSFSSQEWCGQVYEEAVFGPRSVKVETKSYFQDESRNSVLPGVVDSEDAFWISARGLTKNGPGEFTGEKQFLGTATLRRLRHLNASPTRSKLTWSPTKKITVPAGNFDVRSISWQRQDRVLCTLDVEMPTPHRIVRWYCRDGEKAELTGTRRIPYWQLSREGDEEKLKALGLTVPR